MSDPRPDRVVDAHHHLWDLEQLRYPWLQDGPPPDQDDSGLAPIRVTHLPEHYREAAAGTGVVGTVHIEAAHDPRQPTVETEWIDAAARREGFPQALVAHAQLEAPELPEVLDGHAMSPRFRGVRQMLNWEPDEQVAPRPGMLDDEAWLAGLGLLGERGLVFELQVFPSQLARAAEVVAEHQDVLFVLDHGGYLQEATDERTAQWRQGLRLLAESTNLMVKASSYGSIDPGFDLDGLRRYTSELAEVFGPDRLLWGSNFPVEGRHVAFAAQLEAYVRATADWEPRHRAAFYADNALRVYRIAERDLAPVGGTTPAT